MNGINSAYSSKSQLLNRAVDLIPYIFSEVNVAIRKGYARASLLKIVVQLRINAFFPLRYANLAAGHSKRTEHDAGCLIMSVCKFFLCYSSSNA